MKDSASAWLPAIFGLLGVLVGGGLSGAVQWWFERRRERAELRFAARVLTGDFAWFRDTLEQCVEESDWKYWILMTHRRPEAMTDHIDRLARTAEYRTWWVSQSAQRALLMCELFATAEREDRGPDSYDMEEEDLALAKSAIEACEDAGGRLDELKT